MTDQDADLSLSVQTFMSNSARFIQRSILTDQQLWDIAAQAGMDEKGHIKDPVAYGRMVIQAYGEQA